MAELGEVACAATSYCSCGILKAGADPCAHSQSPTSLLRSVFSQSHVKVSALSQWGSQVASERASWNYVASKLPLSQIFQNL